MMKKLELDLRDVKDDDVVSVWNDHPARAWLENAILDFAGKVVVVRITEKRSALTKSEIKTANVGAAIRIAAHLIAGG